MPDGLGGAGFGLGGGAAAAVVAYVLDKTLGSGKTLSSLDERFAKFKEWIEVDLKNLTKTTESTAKFVERIFDMHNVLDPDDPSGKIWYFSVGLRTHIKSLSERVTRLVDLIDKVVNRFDQYNTTLAKLIQVVDKLQADVSALGVMISTTSR